MKTDTYPEPTEHCEVCSWFPLCDTRRRADDHPSLVAGISRNQRKALAERGVSTVAQLAKITLPPKPKIERIGDAALPRIREQARLQEQGREEGRLIYELLDGVKDGNGLAALPSPSSADMFLDFESNPYVLDQGLEYLIGVVTLSVNSYDEPAYETLWSSTRGRKVGIRDVHSQSDGALASEPGDAHLPLRPIRADRHQASGREARDMRR